ncbi:hypothetical protein GO730_31880 [Spirosoma sp. HMF3257]|uniref:Uncharacterized protein n=1 Tax=Spirosoma telluris TaxID=2183553 RepID=A0A327NUR3_9BACT|nr:hypothetical protein [Spirosoma telluris]RAI77594.1 hypothetical protein HMF3257_31775 [Spirosoma telluris]
MTIQFSEQEIGEMRNYFTKIGSGETQNQLHGLHQAFPEWNTIFLLLRKLLAYGVLEGIQTDSEISYSELQKKSTKPNDMLVIVHRYIGQFDSLLATYIAHQ